MRQQSTPQTPGFFMVDILPAGDVPDGAIEILVGTCQAKEHLVLHHRATHEPLGFPAIAVGEPQ